MDLRDGLYVLLWWCLDGLGRIIWGRSSGDVDQRLAGVGQLVSGAITLGFVSAMPQYSARASAMIIVAGLCLRILIWPGRDGRAFLKHWRRVGSPTIWTGLGSSVLLLMVLALITCRAKLVPQPIAAVERIVWSWALSAVIASMLSPGAHGLAMNPFTRWMLRVTSVGAIIAGTAMMVSWMIGK